MSAYNLPNNPADGDKVTVGDKVFVYRAAKFRWEIEQLLFPPGTSGGGIVEHAAPAAPLPATMLTYVPVPQVPFPGTFAATVTQYLHFYGTVTNGTGGTIGASHTYDTSLVYAGMSGALAIWSSDGLIIDQELPWDSGQSPRIQMAWDPDMAGEAYLRITTTNGFSNWTCEPGLGLDELGWTPLNDETGIPGTYPYLGIPIPEVNATLKLGPYEPTDRYNPDTYEWYLAETIDTWRRIHPAPVETDVVGRRVVVRAGRSAADNGSALADAKNRASEMSPSASAPVTIVLEPGDYSTSVLNISAMAGVNLVGSTGNPTDVRITGGGGNSTLIIGLDNIVRGVTVSHTGAAVPIEPYAATTTATALRVTTSAGATRGPLVEDVVLCGNVGRILSVSTTAALTGTFRRVRAMAALVAGAGDETWRPFAHGIDLSQHLVFEDCRAGNNSFGAWAANPIACTITRCQAGIKSFGYESHVDAAAVITDCVGGEACFGSSISGGLLWIYGRFERCRGGNASFSGLSSMLAGRFVDCEAGDFSFSGPVDSGTFLRCRAGNASFTACANSLATFESCVAGWFSFTSGSELAGTFRDCVAGDGSFSVAAGMGDVPSITGEFIGCRAGGESFSICSGAPGGRHAGTFRHCRGGGWQCFTNVDITHSMDSTFHDCVANDNSFGHLGVSASARFYRCVAGPNSFAGAYGNAGFHGEAHDCTGGGYCFGYYNGIGATARLIRCKAGLDSFGASGPVLGTLEDCEATGLGSFGGSGGSLRGVIRRCKAPLNMLAVGGHLGGRIEDCLLSLSYSDGPTTVDALFVGCELEFNISSNGAQNNSQWPSVLDADSTPVSKARLDRCLVHSDTFKVDGIAHPEYHVLSTLNDGSSGLKLDMHDTRAVSASVYHKQAEPGPVSPARARRNDGDLKSLESYYY